MKPTKGKKFCSQNATKLIEKSSVCNLKFGLSSETSTNFTQKEDFLENIDSELKLHFRRLDKKDNVTKIKSMKAILKYFEDVADENIYYYSIHYWSKIYSKLSNDDDKEIRELTQTLMQIYAIKCGKNLSQHLKKILPNWISSQSDFHKPAADIAIKSFKETFTDDSKRTKAYFLFWDSIYTNVKTIIIDTPSKSFPNEIIYSESIGMQIRTLITMLPYFNEQQKPIKDIQDLLKDKRFWSHIDNNNSLVTRIYLQFSQHLLEYLPEVCKDKTVCQHILICFRMINSDSNNTLEIWKCIDKCVQVYGNEIWSMVSFKSVVLPKLLKLIETGLNFQLSNIVGYILVLIRNFPLDFSSPDHDKLIIKLLNTIISLYQNPQICNNLNDSSAVSSLFCGTSIFLIFSAQKFANHQLSNLCWDNVVKVCENYLTGDISLKSDDFTKIFAEIILKNVYIKKLKVINSFIDTFISFLEINYKNEIFCERMTKLLRDITHIDNDEFKEFKEQFFSKLVSKLHEKSLLSNGEFCLIPYFYLNSYENSENIKQVESFGDFWKSCQTLIKEYDNLLFYQIISDGLSFLMNNIENDKKMENYTQFFEMFSGNSRYLFFNNFYLLFFDKLDKCSQKLISEYTVNIWISDFKTELDLLIHHDKTFSNKEINVVFKILPKSPMHQIFYKNLIGNLTVIIEKVFSTTISLEIAENLILFTANVLQYFKSQSILSMVPYNLIKMLLRLLICNDESDCHDLGLKVLKYYVEYCSLTDNSQNNLDLLNYLLSSPCYNDMKLQANLLNILLTNDENNLILDGLKMNLIADLNELERSYSLRWKYTKLWSNNNTKTVESLLHNVCLLVKMLKTSHNNDDFNSQFGDFNIICLLLSSALTDESFCSCEKTNSFLEKCDFLFNHLNEINIYSEFDNLLKGFSDANVLNFYDDYPCLLVKWLNLQIPIEHSKWSSTTKEIMTHLTDNWCVDDVRSYWLTINFALPKSIKGRYLNKDIVLAQLNSYLNRQTDQTLSISQINRSIGLMTTLISCDIDYHSSCFPLLLDIKSNFQDYLNSLQPGYNSCYPSTDNFELAPLLQLLTVVMETMKGDLLNSSDWEFILCLAASLIRSEQFKSCTDHIKDPIDSTDNTDKLVSGYWLLKLITNIAINIASVTNNDSLLDEWENFFSENLFREVLDQFSHVAGSYEKQGKLVYHELFELYCEQLCEAISVCPINVLNNYSFPVYINIDDPIELPKDCLEKMNYFLESLSNYNLSVQIASYNCLINISEQLRDFLNNEVNKIESADDINSFKLTLPMKLVEYLECPKLKGESDMESISYQIRLTRCFLSWHLILELVRLSAPKLRAELTQFLQQYYRQFLSFCFTFMPQNPIIVKSRFCFLVRYNESKSKMNLIRQIPKLFEQCIEERSNYQLFHFACYLFGKCVQTLPSLTRTWWLALQNKSQITVEEYVRRYITPEIFRREFQQLEQENTAQNQRIAYGTAYEANDDERRMEISTIPMLGEVTVRYYFNEDQFVEQLIQLPQNYPLGMVSVKLKKEFNPIRDNKWRTWNIQITATMQNQNGTFLDGVRLLKNQLDSYMSGIEECMVCYSILHATKYTLPNTRCKQCKKKYHKDCLYKWFESSPTPSCPNCRHLFFDGTYRNNFRRPVVPPNQADEDIFDNFNGDPIQFLNIDDLM